MSTITYLASYHTLPAQKSSLFFILFVNILRAVLDRRSLLDLLVGHVPIVEITGAGLVTALVPFRYRRRDVTAYTEVGSKAQPAHIWHNTPCSNGVNLRPDICQVTSNTCQSHNVDGGFNGTLETEEKWHPNKVQAKLNCVKGCTLLHNNF